LIFLNRSVKVFVAATLISLIVYVTYILNGSLVILFGYLAHVPSDVNYVRMTGLVFWFGFVGLGARFIAVILGLAAIYMLWIKSKAFLKIKVLVALAIFLEGLLFLSETPSVWFLLRPGFTFSLSLGISYILQILLTVPFLWVLAFKAANYHGKNERPSLLKFGAIAFVGYIAALAVNELSRWTSMISAETLRFLSQGITIIGFLNAFLLMPLAIVLAIVGAFKLIQQKNRSATVWIGASLAMVGLNYSIYVIYSYFTNSLNSLPLVDVWTIPFLGLGIALIINSRKIKP
jgi:hypothetical protein